MTKTISLLGCTGSIGRQTLEVARELGLRVAALAAHSSVDLLEAQAREFHPRLAVLYDDDAADALRRRLCDTDIEVRSGAEGLLAAAQVENLQKRLSAADPDTAVFRTWFTAVQEDFRRLEEAAGRVSEKDPEKGGKLAGAVRALLAQQQEAWV